MRLFIRILHRCEDGFLIAALVAMLSIAVMQIILRNGFDSGFLWAESFLRILVLWIAMLGAMVATRERNHISIDALSRYLSGKAAVAARVIVGLAASSVLAIAAYHSIEIIGYEYEDQTIAFANVPTWICQSIIPIGLGIMSLRFLIGIFVPAKLAKEEMSEEGGEAP